MCADRDRVYVQALHQSRDVVASSWVFLSLHTWAHIRWKIFTKMNYVHKNSTSKQSTAHDPDKNKHKSCRPEKFYVQLHPTILVS